MKADVLGDLRGGVAVIGFSAEEFVPDALAVALLAALLDPVILNPGNCRAQPTQAVPAKVRSIGATLFDRVAANIAYVHNI